MIDPKELKKIIQIQIIMVLCLLQDKHTTMFSRKGIEENETLFLVPNCWFIISIEFVVKLKEALILVGNVPDMSWTGTPDGDMS